MLSILSASPAFDLACAITLCALRRDPAGAARPDPRKRELFGKRASARFPKNRPVVVVPGWGADSMSAVMLDLSLTGIRVLAPTEIAVNQAFRILDADFEAVALVAASRRCVNDYSIHARFLTLRLIRRTGTIVSAKA